MDPKLFAELCESIQEATLIAEGNLTPPPPAFGVTEPSIPQIRQRYKLSQNKFAALLGVSVSTLRKWEQGQRNPTGPARKLLKIALSHPMALLEEPDRVTEAPLLKSK
ncbi:MAG: helix-turn-helix domain-containing protein [SAR324 cluster bacterium]|nr:helix-turn-helix domain-containing protein [SAR324 cluster bacterium]